MKVADFDYFLPQELIAQYPIEPRDNSRLLVLQKDEGSIEHKKFNEVCDYFVEGDVLVLNTTKVIPARLLGIKTSTGAKVEIFLLKQIELNTWEVLARPSKRIPEGAKIEFAPGFECVILNDLGDGKKLARFEFEGDFFALLDLYGEMPLPPYIKEELEKKDRYQTVYANVIGSVAAPTAGLHFTSEILDKLRTKGVIITEVLLHVGLGTFRPVKVDDIIDHKMHSEYYEITENTAVIINSAKIENRRVFGVGTTTVRTLESAAMDGKVKHGVGWTDIFIYPGYNFKIIDCMITNFHLPKSTLLMLVSAFAGKENVLQAYHEAIKQKYRFFSFGDAMLII